MTTAKQELYDLAEDSSNPEPSANENLTKDDVISAIHEYSEGQHKAQKQAEREERQQEIQKQRAEEQRALQEVSEAVKTSLKEEMSRDKDFAKLVEKTDLPGGLIDYIWEVGEPEEAALIVRELANNDEYQQSLRRAKTEVGVRRILSKIRKDVFTGGSQGKVPPMLKKSIPNYNYNTTSSGYDQDYYADLAMRHGISG